MLSLAFKNKIQFSPWSRSTIPRRFPSSKLTENSNNASKKIAHFLPIRSIQSKENEEESYSDRNWGKKWLPRDSEIKEKEMLKPNLFSKIIGAALGLFLSLTLIVDIPVVIADKSIVDVGGFMTEEEIDQLLERTHYRTDMESANEICKCFGGLRNINMEDLDYIVKKYRGTPQYESLFKALKLMLFQMNSVSQLDTYAQTVSTLSKNEVILEQIIKDHLEAIKETLSMPGTYSMEMEVHRLDLLLLSVYANISSNERLKHHISPEDIKIVQNLSAINNLNHSFADFIVRNLEEDYSKSTLLANNPTLRYDLSRFVPVTLGFTVLYNTLRMGAILYKNFGFDDPKQWRRLLLRTNLIALGSISSFHIMSTNVFNVGKSAEVAMRSFAGIFFVYAALKHRHFFILPVFVDFCLTSNVDSRFASILPKKSE